MKKKGKWKGAHYQEEEASQGFLTAFNIKADITYIHDEYELVVLPKISITEQGLQLIGKIKPKNNTMPEFLIRWDEKDNHLNVDIVPEEKLWKRGIQGYKGHLAEKLKDRAGRAFSLIIETPASKVFNGVVSFNLARDRSLKTSTGMSATVTHEVTHISSNNKLSE
jgi:hypothetical protein